MGSLSLVLVYLGERSFLMDLYAKEFRKKGVKVLFAECFPDAQKILKSEAVDIILVNINNTKLNSCRLIRDLSYTFSLPVVATGVAHSEREKAEYITTCGARAFIEEPLSAEACLEEIKDVLEMQRRENPRLKNKGSLQAKVFCTYDNTTVECELVDLSTGGMRVLSPQKMPSGRSLYFIVKLELNREIFTLNTETMIKPSEDHYSKNSGRYAYQIIFVNLSTKECETLQGFINSYVQGDSSFAYYG